MWLLTLLRDIVCLAGIVLGIAGVFALLLKWETVDEKFYNIRKRVRAKLKL